MAKSFTDASTECLKTLEVMRLETDARVLAPCLLMQVAATYRAMVAAGLLEAASLRRIFDLGLEAAGQAQTPPQVHMLHEQSTRPS